MTSEEHLINQHILEYESRLKHLDELLKEAEKSSKQTEELNRIKEKRNELRNYVDSVKSVSLDHWEEDTIKSAGPMAVWDAVAQKLEKLIEGKK